MSGVDRNKEEQHAFDMQIVERIRHGHVPDLRRAKKCDYFYNNSWRHPDYVALDFKEQFEVIEKVLRDFMPCSNSPKQVLEVGCGPGHLSLELARSGFDVQGIDLSQKCIDIAQKVAATDPWKKSRGILRYDVADFFVFSKQQTASFDAVIFLGALHHFKDQDRVMQGVLRLLKPRGVLVVHEPTRDRVTEGNAVFMHLLQVLLGVGRGFYRQVQIPKNKKDYDQSVLALFRSLKYEDAKGGKTQSANDNEAGFSAMAKALRRSFVELHYRERYAFFHELIGGLRFSDKKNKELARYLRETDRSLCALGVLQSTEFLFVGRKKRK